MNGLVRILAGALVGFVGGYLGGATAALLTVGSAYELSLQALCVALAVAVSCSMLETLPAAWGWKRSAIAGAIAPVCYATFAWLLSDRAIDLVAVLSSSVGYSLTMAVVGHRFFADTYETLVESIARFLTRHIK
jgi:hypothetical protein